MKEELEQRYADIRNFEPGEDEKFVYVRLFHNQFEKLPMFNQLYDISWLKNILESLANTEAHGYAIFENEEDVEASIKAKNKPHLYCHARLLIKKDQDISNDRPHKIDELINIPLVTLAPLEMKSLQHILLSYGGSQYYIFMQNGRINVQLLTVEEDETDDDFE